MENIEMIFNGTNQAVAMVNAKKVLYFKDTGNYRIIEPISLDTGYELSSIQRARYNDAVKHLKNTYRSLSQSYGVLP